MEIKTMNANETGNRPPTGARDRTRKRLEAEVDR